MIVFTDSRKFAEMVMLDEPRWEEADMRSFESAIREIADQVFEWETIYQAEVQSTGCFEYMFICEHAFESQYDFMINLCKQNRELPPGILLLAGSGTGFHGQRERLWDSPPGNIYLTAFFRPNREIASYAPGFMALSAVSVIEAIDCVESMSGRSSIKWVNDIVIGNAKVGGVLAYTQAIGSEVTGAVLGIGLNVEAAPEIELSEFVPDVACLCDYVEDIQLCKLRTVLDALTSRLEANYRALGEGEYPRLLAKYRERCTVIGREVVVCADNKEPLPDIIASGRVSGVGDNLELLIEDVVQPIANGRLILKPL
jgi:biotin-[acetyl-CoA-carboxylase] ligase BirA-like protein